MNTPAGLAAVKQLQDKAVTRPWNGLKQAVKKRVDYDSLPMTGSGAAGGYRWLLDTKKKIGHYDRYKLLAFFATNGVPPEMAYDWVIRNVELEGKLAYKAKYKYALEVRRVYHAAGTDPKFYSYDVRNRTIVGPGKGVRNPRKYPVANPLARLTAQKAPRKTAFNPRTAYRSKAMDQANVPWAVVNPVAPKISSLSGLTYRQMMDKARSKAAALKAAVLPPVPGLDIFTQDQDRAIRLARAAQAKAEFKARQARAIGERQQAEAMDDIAMDHAARVEELKLLKTRTDDVVTRADQYKNTGAAARAKAERRAKAAASSKAFREARFDTLRGLDTAEEEEGYSDALMEAAMEAQEAEAAAEQAREDAAAIEAMARDSDYDI